MKTKLAFPKNTVNGDKQVAEHVLVGRIIN